MNDCDEIIIIIIIIVIFTIINVKEDNQGEKRLAARVGTFLG